MERDPTTMLVANNIKRLMAEQGTDAANLARTAGLNATGVYDILSGKSRSPKVETIAKIARGLGVPLSAIFEEQWNSVPDERQDLLKLFEQMPEAQKELLLQTARAWLPARQSA